MLALLGEPLVALSHALIGDQRRRLALAQRLEVVLAVIPSIRGEHRLVRAHRPRCVHHRQQAAVLGAALGEVGRDDHAVLRVDGGLCRVALDHALAGRHLGRLVVGDVALELGAFGIALGGVLRDELACRPRFPADPLDLGAALRIEVVVALALVFGAVRLDDLAGRLLQALGAVLQFCVRAAALLARVRGQLHAVDREQLLADQAQPIAGHQHLLEQHRNVVAQLAHELRDVSVARRRVARDRDERDVLTAGPFDRSAADQTAAVGQQHDLQHHPRVVGRGAGLVVVEPGVERREVQLVVHEPVERELERAWLDLLAQHHGQESRASVDLFVPGHRLVLRRSG